MALTTTPTYAAVTVNTQEAASIRDTNVQTRYVHSIASPTFKIFWANRKSIKVGPDKKIRGNQFHGLADAWVSSASGFEFPTKVKDNLSQIQYDVMRIGSSTAITDEDLTDYRNEQSLYDLGEGRVSEMHGGLTYAMNYMMWSGAGVQATELSGDGKEIDLDTFMDNTPGVKILGDIDNLDARFHSIPQVIRGEFGTDGSSGTATRHTFGNMQTDNAAWNSKIDFYGTVTLNDTGDNNKDGIVSAITNPQSFTEKMLTDLLGRIQIGDDYMLYVPMPTKIYDSVVRILKAQERGTPQNPIAHLGIRKALEHPSYNAVLYAEPILNNSNMWPNSIWVYDPRHTFLVVIEGFGPKVYPWQRVGFGTTLGTAEYVRCNIICTDRRSCGAIHGVAPV